MKFFLLCFIFTFTVSINLISNCFADSNNTIKIGWIGPIIGDDAFIGVDSVAVLKRIISETNNAGGINGRKLEILFEDDQYLTPRSVTAYRKLVDAHGVKVIFVLTYGGMLAISPLAQKDGVILIDPLDCDEQLASLPDNSFCVAKRTEDLGIITAQQAIKDGNTPAAILYFDADPFPQKVALASKEVFDKNSTPPVVFQGIPNNASDFRSILLTARKKEIKSLFLYGYDDLGMAMRQARQLGIKAQFYTLAGSVNSPGFQMGAGSTINGSKAVGWFAPKSKLFSKFISEHIADVGRAPLFEMSSVASYDMMNILISAFKEINTSSSELFLSNLKDKLYSIKDYQGLCGNISMDEDGAVRSLKVGMYQYNNEQFTEIK